MPLVNQNIFGQNFEITRSAGFGGIYSEKINNRKFASLENGFPSGFYAVETSEEEGMGQTSDQLYFKAGERYIVRIWAKSQTDTVLTCELKTSCFITCHTRSFPLSASEDFSLLEYDFVLPSSLARARFEVRYAKGNQVEFFAFSIKEADHFYGMRKDVVQLLKRIRPAFLRYPGGCYAEYFHWKDTLLPVDMRPSVKIEDLGFVLPDSYGNDPCEIGIDEFIQLCRYTGADPQITVRMSENTPEDAADLVEYCNGSVQTYWGKIRAQRGFPEPYHVKVWYVGNEIAVFGREGLTDYHVASERHNEFAAAMKKVDPTIQLVASTGLLPEWDEGFLEGNPVCDLLSYHCYLQDQFPGKENMQQVIQAPFTYVCKLLKAFQHRHVGRSISFDEWNYCWGRNGSVMTALFAAGMIHMLVKHQEELNLRQACYFEPINEGAIQVTPYGAWLRPDGMVFELLANHGGNQLLEQECESGIVDVLVTVSNDTGVRRKIVSAINTDVTHTYSLDLKAFTGCRMVRCFTLTPEVHEMGNGDSLIRKQEFVLPEKILPMQIVYLELEE